MKYKYKSLKTYSSPEWLRYTGKKYRNLFDKNELSYIYVEFSFINKMYDEEDWTSNISLKAFRINSTGGAAEESDPICELTHEQKIDKDQHTIFIRDGWGSPVLGEFWKAGEYEWRAYIGGRLVAKSSFYIYDVGRVSDGFNPYFNVKSLRFFEDDEKGRRKPKPVQYQKTFEASSTRYIYAELILENKVRHLDWNLELEFHFFNSATQSKAQTLEWSKIGKGEEHIRVVTGWGANSPGIWFEDKFRLNAIFMNTLVASGSFEVGSSAVVVEGNEQLNVEGQAQEFSFSNPTIFQIVKELINRNQLERALDQIVAHSDGKNATELGVFRENIKFIEQRILSNVEEYEAVMSKKNRLIYEMVSYCKRNF
ncbi:MAG: hypothetical protein MRZ79_10860 [Bacteroidia bacterium]|nr:hypothetical protein [Bacteroidia bacterium]